MWSKILVMKSFDGHCLIQGDSSGLPCFKGESLSCEFFKRDRAWLSSESS